MTDETWKAVWDLLEQTRASPPQEREAFVRAARADQKVIEEALALLAEPSSGRWNTPAPDARQPALTLLESGSCIGRYTITGRLGSGGMGDTFAARDEELHRPVAIKVLRPPAGGDTTAPERFIREARAASALNHPNIVTVFEAIQFGQTSAIVMELVEGRLLRQWCGEAQPMETLVRLSRQLALALAAAHAASLVHRDVKPENIIVRGDGFLKLLDFGLARRLDASPSTQGSAGTLRYMSPEQLRGQALTAGTDVFSLGLVMFEMAAGRHPFAAEVPLDTMLAIVTAEAPALDALNPQIPASLAGLIGRMLAKEPESRPTAEQVAARLTEIERTTTAPATAAAAVPARGRKRSWALPAALLAVAAIAGVTIWMAGRPHAPNKPKGFVQITNYPFGNNLASAAISPDGERVALVDSDGEVRLQSVTGHLNRFVTRLPNVLVNQIYWIGQSGSLLVSALAESKELNVHQIGLLNSVTGKYQVIPVSGKAAVPSPDGKRISYVSVDSSELWVANLGGTEPHRVAVSLPGSISWVGWSPSGQLLHYWWARRWLGLPGELEDVTIRTVDASTGARVGEQAAPELWPGFMQSDGQFLMRSSQGLMGATLDKTGHFPHPPRLIANDILDSCVTASSGGRRIAAVRHTNYGRIIHVAETPRGRLSLMNPRPLALELAETYPHAWTPDNGGVIFEGRKGKNKYQIQVQRLDSKYPRLLAPSPEFQVIPMVSPDGRWVVFMSTKTFDLPRHYSLMRAPIEGGGQPELIPTGGPVQEFNCLYRAKRCVMREMQEDQAVFFDLDPLRGKGRELTRVRVSSWLFGDWSLSPDGTMVAMTDATTKPPVLRVVYLERPPLEKAIPIEGTVPLGLPVWTADGAGWYVRTQGDSMRLIGWDGSNRFVARIPGWAVPSWDGKRIAYLDEQRDYNVWLLDLDQ